MFARALQSVDKYTKPVIISKRMENGNVEASCGAFIVVNSDGWVITASHILQDLRTLQEHRQEKANFAAQRARAQAEPNIKAKQRKKLLRQFEVNPKWLTHVSHYWSFPNATLQDIAIYPFADLAVGRLVPFDASSIPVYPVFKNPNGQLLPGTSLCRLGFPFHTITVTFDEVTSTFRIADGVLPVPFFPNEGIHTRVAIMGAPSGEQTKFIETSSPGLRGQSGGPIFDAEGNVWAIQSRTMSLPMGFSPAIKVGGREVTEHQFMHVGWGSHVEEMIKILSKHNIKHRVSDT